MTDEELDEVRAEEAWNIIKRNEDQDVALIAARLAREGWMPPEPVDPDLAEAEYLAQTEEADRLVRGGGYNLGELALAAIKRGRELERAEAKPTFFDALTANSALCRAEEMIRSARHTLEIITQPEEK